MSGERISTLRKRVVEPEPPVKPLPVIPYKLETSVEMESLLPERSKNIVAKWPETAFYDTISNNIVGEGLHGDVADAIEMGLQAEHHITCGCPPGTDCSTNPSCKCNSIAAEMAHFYEAEHLTYGKPIDGTVKDFFWKKMMIACGTRCGCKGKCAQNGIRDIDSNHDDKFFIQRTNMKGFCLYTKVPIAKGQPVLSFNGEICGYNGIKQMDDNQYALLLYDQDHAIKRFFTNRSYIEKSYLELLRKAYDKKVWINPLRRGNCARFLSHACKANLEPGRVFQGGFSPADVRIVYFAIDDIPIGTELTFDYGLDYKDVHLRGACLCVSCKPETESQIPRKRFRASRRNVPQILSDDPETPSEELTKLSVSKKIITVDRRESSRNGRPKERIPESSPVSRERRSRRLEGVRMLANLDLSPERQPTKMEVDDNLLHVNSQSGPSSREQTPMREMRHRKFVKKHSILERESGVDTEDESTPSSSNLRRSLRQTSSVPRQTCRRSQRISFNLDNDSNDERRVAGEEPFVFIEMSGPSKPADSVQETAAIEETVVKPVVARKSGRPRKIRKKWPVSLEERRKRRVEFANDADDEEDQQVELNTIMTRCRTKKEGFVILKPQEFPGKVELDPTVKRGRGRPRNPNRHQPSSQSKKEIVSSPTRVLRSRDVSRTRPSVPRDADSISVNLGREEPPHLRVVKNEPPADDEMERLQVSPSNGNVIEDSDLLEIKDYPSQLEVTSQQRRVGRKRSYTLEEEGLVEGEKRVVHQSPTRSSGQVSRVSPRRSRTHFESRFSPTFTVLEPKEMRMEDYSGASASTQSDMRRPNRPIVLPRRFQD